MAHFVIVILRIGAQVMAWMLVVRQDAQHSVQ